MKNRPLVPPSGDKYQCTRNLHCCEWESGLGTGSKRTFIACVKKQNKKKTVGSSCKFPLMCDFVAAFYRNSGETF